MAKESYHKTPTKFGMLAVENRLPGSKYLCRCDCGKSRVVSVGHFNTGTIKSCGCHVTRHGHSRIGARSPTYTCYHNMLARCHKKSNKRYLDYGGRGITVCRRWRESFTNFLDDMGESPEGKTIDRIDNTKGYYPENCRWATRKQNQRNRGCSKIWVIHGSKYPTLDSAAEANGVSGNTIRAWCLGRIAAGRTYKPKAGCYCEEVYGSV